MNIADLINGLRDRSTAELAAEYERLFGKKPRYRSPAWLRKRIAYKAQENALGGLSGAARAEVHRLAADIELPARPTPAIVGNDKANKPGAQLRPGTVLQREWRGQQIRVEVQANGFTWNGENYGSLSAVARAVTGSRWNGKLFFNLVERSKR